MITNQLLKVVHTCEDIVTYLYSLVWHDGELVIVSIRLHIQLQVGKQRKPSTVELLSSNKTCLPSVQVRHINRKLILYPRHTNCIFPPSKHHNITIHPSFGRPHLNLRGNCALRWVGLCRWQQPLAGIEDLSFSLHSQTSGHELH